MTAIVVLNIVLSAFVIVGVLSLLARGIVADSRNRAVRPVRGRRVTTGAARRSRPRLGRALRTGA